MRFDKKNDHLRPLYMKDNLWGGFTVGWNHVRSNSLGLRLVRGGVDGLTQIENIVTFPENISPGLLFVT